MFCGSDREGAQEESRKVKKNSTAVGLAEGPAREEIGLVER